jgi:hypothetical protein
MKVQQIQFLEKYAALAEDLLSKKYGQDYTSADIEKLAEALITMDLERASELDRIEEITKCASYLAKGFSDEIDNICGEGSFKKLAAYKSRAFVNTLKKLVGKSKTGKKAVGWIDKTEKRVRGVYKKDPTAVVGGATIIGGGGLAAGTVLSEE